MVSVMAASTPRALREQLTAIMAALTEAAVAEICGLVGERYAALRSENQALRSKLRLIESIIVPGQTPGLTGGQTPGLTGGQTLGQTLGLGLTGGQTLGPGLTGGQTLGQTLGLGLTGGQTLGPGLTGGQTLGQTLGLGLTGGQTGGPAGPGAEGPGQTPDTERLGDAGSSFTGRELPDVVLIKDEDSDSNDTLDEGTSSSADGRSVRASSIEGAAGPQGRKKRLWPGSEDCVFQAERRSSDHASKLKKAAPHYVAERPPAEPGPSGPAGGDGRLGARCDVRLAQRDCGSPASGADGHFGGDEPPGESRSPGSRADLDLLVWGKAPRPHGGFAAFQSDAFDGDAFGLKLVSVSGATPSECQLSESGSCLDLEEGEAGGFGLYRDQGGRGRRYVCAVCSKTYATSQNLEVHMRIHTGERPFSCEQCGKKFTQSAHLKSHLSVHSGERPYACTLCSRSFIVKYSLKLHLKKCHPAAPLSPAQHMFPSQNVDF